MNPHSIVNRTPVLIAIDRVVVWIWRAIVRMKGISFSGANDKSSYA
jgi:hypothetical protein